MGASRESAAMGVERYPQTVQVKAAGVERERETGEEMKTPHQNSDFHMSSSRLDRLNPANPLRVAMANKNAPSSSSVSRSVPLSRPAPHLSPILSQPPFTPTTPTTLFTPQQSVVSLNSRRYTNRLSLVLFLLHATLSVCLVFFLIFKGILAFIAGGTTIKQHQLNYLTNFLPQVEAASLLSIILGFSWQKAITHHPKLTVHFILWSTFSTSLSASILLLCLQSPPTTALGVFFLLFSVSNGLYNCWIARRIPFCTQILINSLELAVAKFPDLSRPTYWMLASGFLWTSLCVLAVIGALKFYLPAVTIAAMVVSLAWTAEVMRNVANLTVSRVVSLYYLRGIQANTQFCFQRALSRNLGSAALGSLFVPTIEALRVVARALNLLEGEDEFLFSCAHCCLKVMGTVFRYGNGWAYVQIAAYGKSFVSASQDTWQMFEKLEGMEIIVDSDITTSLCFLSGVCSGSICVILVAAWTSTVQQGFTATISLFAFFIGYLMTRIAMALPHACVSCYYVCYAENPQNRLFNRTIQDRIDLIKAGRDMAVPTPRVPHRFTR